MKKAIAIILSIMLVLAITLPAAAVSSIAVKSVKLNNSKITLKVGQTSNLKVIFTPANTTQKKLTYVTGNKKIATVNAAGKITGVSAGTTTITVYTLNKKIFAKCNVTISQPQQKLKLKWMIPTQQKVSVTESVVVKEIMKKFNVEFDMIELAPADQHPEKKKLLIASQDIPDIMTWVTKDEGNLYGPQGAFLELTPYLGSKLTNVKKLLDSDLNGKYNAFTTDNKIFRIPDYNVVSLPIFDFGYKKGEFDAVGATKLDNWNDVYNAFKKLKAKYPDSYPFVVRGKDIGSAGVKSLFIQSFTQGIANSYMCEMPGFDYNANKYIVSVEAPGFKDAITYLNKLYSEKLMDPEYITTDTNALIAKLKEKKGFLLADYIGGLSGIADVNIKCGGDLMPLETPGVEGKKGILGSQPIKIGDRGTVLSSKLKGDKLDRVLDIINYLYSEECYNLLYWNPDVTVVKDGKKLYNDKVYATDSATMDKYLPWSLLASFQVNYETVTKPGTPYADYKINVFMNPANKDRFVPSRLLPFDNDQTKKINDLSKGVKDYYDSKIEQFVTGKMPMDQWDAFVKEMKSMGADEVVAIYNDVNTKYFGK